MYLQDLYRFFRLNPMRNEFHNPFDDSKNYLFFQHSLFAHTALQERILEVASFLIKRQQIADAKTRASDLKQEEFKITKNMSTQAIVNSMYVLFLLLPL